MKNSIQQPASVHPCAPAAQRSIPLTQFQLTPFHRNIPDQELIDDLKRVAQLLKTSTLTQAAYRQHSRFNPLTLTARFDNWNRALTKASLNPSRHFRVPATLVLADVRRIARKLNTHHLTLNQYTALGNYSITLIYRHFKSWSAIVLAAGLTPSTYHPKTSDADLFDNLEHLWHHYNRQPKCTELTPPHSRFGLAPYQRRFGGYQNALIAFTQWKQTKQLPPPHKKPQKTTRSINWRLRYHILKRDNFKCRACGRSPANHPNVQLQIDHIKPWSQGGETTKENLQTLCDQCNIGKSDS